MPSAGRKGQPPAKKARREGKEQLKGRVNELEEAWQGLLEKENNSLLNRLAKENRDLEHVLQQYQTRMESIILCSKECLESTKDVRMDNKIRDDQCSPNIANEDARDHSIRANEDEAGATSSNHLVAPSISLSSSILYQAVCRAGNVLCKDNDMFPNNLCESIMAWKLRTGQLWDFGFLLSYFRWHELESMLRKGMFFVSRYLVADCILISWFSFSFHCQLDRCSGLLFSTGK